ncbi:hypothetical protein HUW51_01815 [Adhaeribacter swui]|uniref:Uncharacterized protein n=1 Tax=Adhaeribacter swui TaxID=2086471 RepID=A0A7G7G2Y7_9BACT|nr:hypothetical protein [Adhaeribacter swui]QNF31521.1 hypothetical protein HUW51_01815 [Adhaeribacter swui]
MLSNSEDSLRSLLEQNYALLEQYSNELERPSIKEERIEEILAQVKKLTFHSMKWLLDLIPSNSDPVQSECLESSLNYLQYALTEEKTTSASRRKVLKRVLYHSKMALLSFLGWGQVIFICV